MACLAAIAWAGYSWLKPVDRALVHHLAGQLGVGYGMYEAAARRPPVFAASAALAIVGTRGRVDNYLWRRVAGRRGRPPNMRRVLAAQVALVAMSSALLVLAALFQERRLAEAAPQGRRPAPGKQTTDFN